MWLRFSPCANNSPALDANTHRGRSLWRLLADLHPINHFGNICSGRYGLCVQYAKAKIALVCALSRSRPFQLYLNVLLSSFRWHISVNMQSQRTDTPCLKIVKRSHDGCYAFFTQMRRSVFGTCTFPGLENYSLEIWQGRHIYYTLHWKTTFYLHLSDYECQQYILFKYAYTFYW